MKAMLLFRMLTCATLAVLALDARAQLTGTLFTQPEEREYLDYLRQEFLRNSADDGFDIADVAIPEIPEGQVAPAGPTEFTFGGLMARRDGSRSVWLNGRLLNESELPNGISVVTGERSASLRISHEGNVYVLRPGQLVDLTTGSVVENFQRPVPPAAELNSAPATVVDSVDEAQPVPPVATEAAAQTSTQGDDLAASASPGDEDGETDAVASAVNDLDDEEVDALFEALENRRLERSQAEEADEAPEDEEP